MEEESDTVRRKIMARPPTVRLLTALVLDIMPDRPESRVVSLASIAHKGARIDLESSESIHHPRMGT